MRGVWRVRGLEMYLGGGLVKMCEGKFEVEDSE